MGRYLLAHSAVQTKVINNEFKKPYVIVRYFFTTRDSRWAIDRETRVFLYIRKVRYNPFKAVSEL